MLVNQKFQMKASSPRTTDVQWSLFSFKCRSFGLGQTNQADKFLGIWVIFGRTISTHFGTVSPLSIFSIFNHFYKKLCLYIPIPNIYLRLGFEFELQRIRVFSHRVSVVRVQCWFRIFFRLLVSRWREAYSFWGIWGP